MSQKVCNNTAVLTKTFCSHVPVDWAVKTQCSSSSKFCNEWHTWHNLSVLSVPDQWLVSTCKPSHPHLILLSSLLLESSWQYINILVLRLQSSIQAQAGKVSTSAEVVNILLLDMCKDCCKFAKKALLTCMVFQRRPSCLCHAGQLDAFAHTVWSLVGRTSAKQSCVRWLPGCKQALDCLQNAAQQRLSSRTECAICSLQNFNGEPHETSERPAASGVSAPFLGSEYLNDDITIDKL